MSSSTALLPKPAKKDDHPIFLRVCHSPWMLIGQNSLVGLRTLTAVYLTVSFGMIMNYDVNRNNKGWSSVFELPNIAHAGLGLYQWTGVIWSFMHLHYPHHSQQSRSPATRIQKLLSPPRQHPESNNRLIFSILYTAATSFPHLATLIHWAVEIPTNNATIPANEILHHGWFRRFFVINKYGVVSAISLLEVFGYSSIRRQTPVSSHMAGMSTLALIYVAWAYAGHEITSKYPYFFLDHQENGWKNTVGSIAAFTVASNFVFGLNYGVTAIRELLAGKSEQKSYGYTTLPQ